MTRLESRGSGDTRVATLTIRPNLDGLSRGLHYATWGFRNLGRALTGLSPLPVPPPRREYSGMTARQYRAARRAYARALTATKRTGRNHS